MEQWLNPQALSAFAALITSVSTALFLVIKDRREAPIERKTAELATATAISDAGKTIVDSAMAINEKMAEQSVRLNDEIKVLRNRVCLWERWHNSLRDTWDTVRTNEHAPDGPDHLEVDNDRVG